MGLKIKKVFKSVAKAVTAPVKAVTSAAVNTLNHLPGGPLNLTGAIHSAFQKFFEQPRQHGEAEYAAQPVPFQLPSASAHAQLPAVQSVLAQTLRQLYGLISPGAPLPASLTSGSFDQVLGNLQQFLGALGGNSSVTGVHPASQSPLASGANKVDAMMKEAERLLLSDNKVDQLRGQRMMQNAQNLFQMLSQLLKAQADMQRAAISNMRV